MDRGLCSNRTREIRRTRRGAQAAARCLAAAIGAAFPSVRVRVDVETVDGEDAFVWIHVPAGARLEGLSDHVAELARRQARVTGYWLVPRLVSGAPDGKRPIRLRPSHVTPEVPQRQ
ncbi:MAG: hypothetical protein FJ029_07215 [Actinobacteria bacterium]|nr:hypothetical protein [Actinomycetota bacterium]